MKKLTKTEMRKNLKKIEKELNNREQWELEDGCVDYSLKLNKDNSIQLKISCDDEVFEDYKIGEIENYDIKSILKIIINFLYENEINYRNNYIRKTRSFNNRKIKSLTLWMERENNDKVQKINEELIERYKITKRLESEVGDYKDYIRDLYCCLDVLCPSWKFEDIKDYCLEKLNDDVRIDIEENKLIVEKNENKFEIMIDDYSRKEVILNKIKNKLEGAA